MQFCFKMHNPSHHINFTCDICGRGYLRKKSLWRHKKYECQKEPAFSCPICNARFKQNIHLKSHMYVHRDVLKHLNNVFKCLNCQKSYDKERSLYVHQLYYCNKESKFSCPQLGCSYRSHLKSNLKRHMLLQHGMTQEEIAAFTDNMNYRYKR
nr:unnamed protein product [Callosobruchus analis]